MVDLSKGVDDPKPMSDNEINDMKNLKKKLEYYKDQLEGDDGHHSHSEDEEDEEDDEEEVQPKKKNIKA